MDRNGRAPEERIASLEQSVRGIQDDIDRLDAGFRSFTTEMRDAVGQIAQRTSDQQRTPWATVFGATTLALTIGGLIGSGYLNAITYRLELAEHSIVKNEERDIARRSDLDDMLQRELRQGDERVEARITGNEKLIADALERIYRLEGLALAR